MAYSDDEQALLKKISICLDQKLLFMTKFLNLTKQIEISAGEDEVSFGMDFEQRQDSINRIDKCNSLIKATVEQLEEGHRAALEQVLKGESCEDELLDGIAGQVGSYKAMLLNAQALDKAATMAFKGRYGEIRDKLNMLRKSKQVKSGVDLKTPTFRRFTQ